MKNKNGFTLIEVVITIMIIAVIAGVMIFRNQKTIGTQKLNKSFAMLINVADAKRHQMLKAPQVKVRGWFYSNELNDNSIYPSNLCDTASGVRWPGYLIFCGYLQKEDWDPYNTTDNRIYLCDPADQKGCCTSTAALDNTIVCLRFKPDDSRQWDFFINTAGECSSSGTGAPPCPSF